MFLPTTPQELAKLGWDRPDIILVTGDSYIDSPFIGSALIGKVLSRAGYRVAIIAQPDIHSNTDICRLGEPRLFWGVTAGSVDSMVANYTSLKKKRKSDDYTPGGVNNRRPDQASIVYTNLIKQYFKHTRPIVLGGIEASLRRIAHYDFWTDRIRPSILFDAKADYLLYGMAEKAVLELATALKNGTEVRDIRGLCYIAGAEESAGKRAGYLALPPFEAVEKDANALTDIFLVGGIFIIFSYEFCFHPVSYFSHTHLGCSEMNHGGSKHFAVFLRSTLPFGHTQRFRSSAGDRPYKRNRVHIVAGG
ncbi:YgiQ family radical SAM protein [Dehalococcoides mccartyi]|uniref:YgiQ family radical SAM protein n=1 Tax=Dehalococcoides mccartyi TaxID=61435 RepID=A0AB33I214_9CHLR|nr:YgiQ family radical SAM protein [Dehalococcoides mccartyi]